LKLDKNPFGSDTPKWVFHRGGGIYLPPDHPDISDAGSNRVKKEKKSYMKLKSINIYPYAKLFLV
jgi:hypothetical protein